MARPVSFILSVASAVFALALPASADVQTLSADAAHTLVQRGELILLDVRTPSEWAMTGMPRAHGRHDADTRQQAVVAPHCMLDTLDIIADKRGFEISSC